jgi:redox-sensing transcriptional repressor
MDKKGSCMVQIPEPAQERLLHLMRLLEKNGINPLTSTQIEGLTGWSSHTIRKDISYLGGDFGTSLGYNPALLIKAIKKALGMDRCRRFCVVGLGRLGSAYLHFRSFDLAEEFELVAGFDINVNRVEIIKSSVPLYPAYKMAEIINRFSIEMALLCVPEDAAQSAAEKLSAAGIRGIINFAPVVLNVAPEIAVKNVYILDELRTLSIKLSSDRHSACKN